MVLGWLLWALFCLILPVLLASLLVRLAWRACIDHFGWPRTWDLLAAGVVGGVVGILPCFFFFTGADVFGYPVGVPGAGTLAGLGIGAFGWLLQLGREWPMRGIPSSGPTEKAGAVFTASILCLSFIIAPYASSSHDWKLAVPLLALDIISVARLVQTRSLIRATKRTL